jgi:hypothetical protein
MCFKLMSIIKNLVAYALLREWHLGRLRLNPGKASVAVWFTGQGQLRKTIAR